MKLFLLAACRNIKYHLNMLKHFFISLCPLEILIRQCYHTAFTFISSCDLQNYVVGQQNRGKSARLWVRQLKLRE